MMEHGRAGRESVTPHVRRGLGSGLRTLLHSCLVLGLIGGSGSAAAQTREWPSERPPRPLASRDIKFPPYQVRTLPNGLQVVAVLHHEQPLVSLRLIVRAGSAFDPKDKLGLARLVASLLDQGTTTKSAGEISDAIDSIGGLMGAGAGIDLSFLSTLVMQDSFETGLRMLSDMARHPAFAQEEVDRQRQQVLSRLRVNLAAPEWVADAVFQRLVYGFHPYGMPDNGTPETLSRLTRDDLVAFHARYFAPNNAILAIVGDVTTEQAFSTATKVFGDWERHDVPQGKFTQPPDPTRRVVVVNMPGAVQTEIRVGHVGIQRNHDDYMVLNLATRILGGEGSNRLHQVLRTERGLTYGAQAVMGTLKEAGNIQASTNTRSEATGEVLRLMVNEIWRMQRQPVGERELADAKAYITGSFPLTIETPGAIALQVLNQLFYGLPLEQLETFRERANAVSADDIQRASRYYFEPGRLSIVLVGNLSVFASQLNGVGFGRYETVELNNLDLTSSDFKRTPTQAGGAAETVGSRVTPVVRPATYRRPRAHPATRVAPEEGSRVKAVLDRVIAAKGGLAALQAVNGIKAVTSALLMGPGDPTHVETTTYLEYTDHVRVEMALPEGDADSGLRRPARLGARRGRRP